LVALATFLPVIEPEEKVLVARLGPSYEEYAARGPRFGPRFAKWTEQIAVETTPRMFLRALQNSLLLLVAWPLCEALELLKQVAHIAPLMRLA
jgi:hypothetical protein